MGKIIGFALLLSLFSVCIARVTPEMRASDHGDPTGNHARDLKYDFYVQIDSRKKVAVPKERGLSVGGLSAEKHTARIWDGDDLIESFVFRFKKEAVFRPISENVALA